MTDETTIRNDSVVRMHYRLTDGDGQEIDSSEGRALAYLHGHGNLVPGLEQQLDGRRRDAHRRRPTRGGVWCPAGG